MNPTEHLVKPVSRTWPPSFLSTCDSGSWELELELEHFNFSSRVWILPQILFSFFQYQVCVPLTPPGRLPKISQKKLVKRQLQECLMRIVPETTYEHVYGRFPFQRMTNREAKVEAITAPFQSFMRLFNLLPSKALIFLAVLALWLFVLPDFPFAFLILYPGWALFVLWQCSVYRSTLNCLE